MSFWLKTPSRRASFGMECPWAAGALPAVGGALRLFEPPAAVVAALPSGSRAPGSVAGAVWAAGILALALQACWYKRRARRSYAVVTLPDGGKLTVHR